MTDVDARLHRESVWLQGVLLLLTALAGWTCGATHRLSVAADPTVILNLLLVLGWAVFTWGYLASHLPGDAALIRLRGHGALVMGGLIGVLFG